MLALMSGFIKLRVTATKEKKQHEAEAGIPISEIKGGGRGLHYSMDCIAQRVTA